MNFANRTTGKHKCEAEITKEKATNKHINHNAWTQWETWKINIFRGEINSRGHLNGYYWFNRKTMHILAIDERCRNLWRSKFGESKGYQLKKAIIFLQLQDSKCSKNPLTCRERFCKHIRSRLVIYWTKCLKDV